MALRLKTIQIVSSREELTRIPQSKTLINTIYAYSYVVAQKDSFFAEALTQCDYLMPDGAGIIKVCRWINAKCQPRKRIAQDGTCFFEPVFLRWIDSCSQVSANLFPNSPSLFLRSTFVSSSHSPYP